MAGLGLHLGFVGSSMKMLWEILMIAMIPALGLGRSNSGNDGRGSGGCTYMTPKLMAIPTLIFSILSICRLRTTRHGRKARTKSVRADRPFHRSQSSEGRNGTVRAPYLRW